MERLIDLDPVQLEPLSFTKFWTLYLRKWFKNYNRNKDPFSEYKRIMKSISKDPSKIFRYGQKHFIEKFKESKSTKLTPSKRKQAVSLVFLLGVPPHELVSLCEKDFQNICGKGNKKFWINYYKKWLLEDPYPIENHYLRLKEIINNYHENALSLLKDGSDNYVQWLFDHLDLSTEHNINVVFAAAATYGRLKWLKWLWKEFKDGIYPKVYSSKMNSPKVNIHIDDDMVFKLAAQEGHLKVLKWLWKISKETGGEEIDMNKVGVDIFLIAVEEGHLDILEWLWKILGETINVHNIDIYAFLIAVEQNQLKVLKWLWNASKGQINIHGNDNYIFKLAEEKEHWEILEWLNTL